MRKLLVWGIPALLLITLVGWRFAVKNATQAQMGKQGAGGRAQSVELAATRSRTIVQSVQSVGNVESPFSVEISPKTTGRIEYLEVREGDVVTPGEVLVKIDPSDLQGAVLQQQASVAETRSRLAQAKLTQVSTNVGVSAQIVQQQAGLGSAQANYQQIQQNYKAQLATAQAQVTGAQSGVANAKAALDKENANLRNAQAKYDRTLSLYNQGFVAVQDVDDARTALDVEKGSVSVTKGQLESAASQLDVQKENLSIVKNKGLSDIEAGKASVTQAKATLNVANANSSQTPAYQQNLAALQSQVDAAVAQLKQAQSKVGDTILRSPIAGTVTARKANPGALASPGTTVLEVQYLDWLYVTATLPIDSSSQIHAGQMAQITIDALPGKTFVGPITNINPAADPQSRQFGLKVRLDNKDHAVRPGMYGHVSIITNQTKADIVVPKEALRIGKDGTTVAVVDKDGVAHVRPVTVGAADDKDVQILSGVEKGEKIVVLAYAPVKDGQKVNLGGPGDGKSGGKGKGGKSKGGASDSGQKGQ